MLLYENYASIGEYMTVIEREGREITTEPIGTWDKRPSREGWVHYATWEEAEHAGREGSAYHRGRVLDLKDRIMDELPDAVSRMSEMVWDVAPGIGFDIARAIEGEPEVWFDLRDKPTDELLIVLDGAFGCGVDAERMERSGAAVAALVEILQGRGIGVTVKKAYGIVSTHRAWRDVKKKGLEQQHGAAERVFKKGSNNSALLTMFTVQQPDSPMDLDALAFWLGSSDAFRRWHFRHLDHVATEARKDVGGGLGYARNFDELKVAFPAAQTMLEGKEYLYLSADTLGASPAFNTDEGAAKWLQEQVLKYVGEMA